MQNFKQEFDSIISGADSVLLATHNDPDGDAVGSILSLYGYLQEKFAGKNIQMMVSTPVNQRFVSFAGFEKLQSVEDIADHLEDFEAVIFVDANYAARFTKKEDQFLAYQGKRIAIDHHPDKGENFVLKHIDTDAASCSQLVYQIFFAEQEKIKPEICETLLMGLLSDTGNFSYINQQNLHVFDMAKRLVKDGNINIDSLSAKFLAWSERTFAIVREMMVNAKVEEIPGWPKFLYTFITPEFVQNGGYSNLETEEASDIFTGYLKSVTEWGFVARNYGQDKVKVSLRSRNGSVNVQAMAEAMGKGSGHVHSSGAKFISSDGGPVNAQDIAIEIKNWMKENSAQLAD